MARKNPYLGSGFESWLDDASIREDVTTVAIRAMIARQIVTEMKKKIIKQRMVALIKRSTRKSTGRPIRTAVAPRPKA
jgi:hypothetical protein